MEVRYGPGCGARARRAAGGGQRLDVRRDLLGGRLWRRTLTKDWLTSAKKPVPDRDLWEPLVRIVAEREDLAFRWSTAATINDAGAESHASAPSSPKADR